MTSGSSIVSLVFKALINGSTTGENVSIVYCFLRLASGATAGLVVFLATIIYFASVSSSGSSSLLLLFQPITATILGAYFFSEILLFGQLIGVIILLIGIYFAGLSERLREINEK